MRSHRKNQFNIKYWTWTLGKYSSFIFEGRLYNIWRCSGTKSNQKNQYSFLEYPNFMRIAIVFRGCHLKAYRFVIWLHRESALIKQKTTFNQMLSNLQLISRKLIAITVFYIFILKSFFVMPLLIRHKLKSDPLCQHRAQIDLVTVFDHILTSRQTGEKLFTVFVW